MKQFFTRTIIVRRLKSAGTDKRNLEATATVDAGVQEAEDNYTAEAGATNRSFKIYTDVGDDIKVNDQIEDSDTGIKYIAKTINKKDYSALQHLEIIADRLEE